MGTSNFYKVNASKYFVFAANDENDRCPHCDSDNLEEMVYDEDAEDFDHEAEDYKCLQCGEIFAKEDAVKNDNEANYQCTLDWLEEELTKKAEECKLSFDWLDKSRYRGDDAKGIFEISVSKDKWVGITLTGLVRYGYYIGATLDWEVSYNIDEEFDHMPDITEIVEELNKEHNLGIAVMNAPKLSKWFEKETDRLTDLVEEIYAKITEPYVRLATFSNGESVYQKVKTDEKE